MVKEMFSGRHSSGNRAQLRMTNQAGMILLFSREILPAKDLHIVRSEPVWSLSAYPHML